MFFEFETNHNQSKELKSSMMMITSKKTSSISPLTIDSSSSSSFLNNNISPSPLRHRRYSMHSFTASNNEQQQMKTLGTLRELSTTNCDLALITKKKLLSLNSNNLLSTKNEQQNSSTKLKSDEEGFIEPDVKLNQTFTKRSNSDLRKEVLLASMMQRRSLSESSEDLTTLNKSSSNIESIVIDDDERLMIITDDDHQMKNESNPINNNKCNMQSMANYMPSETQVNQRSITTFTSTTSMAGTIKNQTTTSNHLQSLNQQQQSNNNDIIVIMDRGYNSYYYSHHSNSPPSSSSLSMLSNICQTVQSSPSPIRTSLMKKRMYSTSPSKPYSPPLSLNHHHQTNKEQQLSSPDWEKAFKRLKVMHASSSSSILNLLDDDQSINETIPLHHHPQQQEQLNELAQDFHRLKTPFT